MLTHKGTQELNTGRLKLRKFTLADAADMFDIYATDERVTRFLTWMPYNNVEDVKSFLSGQIDAYSRDNVYHWAIETGGSVIGSISTVSMDEKNCFCEIGYCIGHDYWNKGIMSEALLAVMGFLFGEVNMRKIIAKHDEENPASGKVMQKCGMTIEGRFRKHYLRHDGTAADSLIYGILKDEFIPADGD